MKKERTMKLSLPKEELMSPGHLACQGCGATMAMRYVLKALGRKTVVCIPACCWAVIDGPFPHSSLSVPIFHCAFEAAASTAAGVKAGLEMVGDTETTVLAWAGDGGTFDIGLQALSGAAERNDDIMYVCYDNEAYMNTGIQRSSTTPLASWTTTTPVGAKGRGKQNAPKNVPLLMAFHEITYVATATLAYLEDYAQKIKKAQAATHNGMAYLHVLCPCPTGWRSPAESAIELCRAAVETNYFPLWEAEYGNIRFTHEEPYPKPIGEFTKLMGRFSHLSGEELQQVQEYINRRYAKLKNLARLNDSSKEK